MTIPPQLEAIEQQVLTDLVRQAVGRETLQLTTWDARPLHYDATNLVSLGVYRLTGLARAGSQTLPWSLILKMVRSPAGVEVMPGIIIPPEADDRSARMNRWPGIPSVARCVRSMCDLQRM